MCVVVLLCPCVVFWGRKVRLRTSWCRRLSCRASAVVPDASSARRAKAQRMLPPPIQKKEGAAAQCARCAMGVVCGISPRATSARPEWRRVPHIEDHVGAAVHNNGSRCPAIQRHQMLVAVDARSRSRAPALRGAHEALPRALQAPGVHSACWAAPNCLSRRPTGAVSRGGRMRHMPECHIRTPGVAPCPASLRTTSARPFRTMVLVAHRFNATKC